MNLYEWSRQGVEVKVANSDELATLKNMYELQWSGWKLDMNGLREALLSD